MPRYCVSFRKSRWCGVEFRWTYSRRAAMAKFVPLALTGVLLFSAATAFAQQQTSEPAPQSASTAASTVTATPASKPTTPKQTIVVTGVYEPLPLGDVDRSIFQVDVPSDEIVSNSLEDYLRQDASVDLQERGVN